MHGTRTHVSTREVCAHNHTCCCACTYLACTCCVVGSAHGITRGRRVGRVQIDPVAPTRIAQRIDLIDAGLLRRKLAARGEARHMRTRLAALDLEGRVQPRVVVHMHRNELIARAVTAQLDGLPAGREATGAR